MGWEIYAADELWRKIHKIRGRRDSSSWVFSWVRVSSLGANWLRTVFVLNIKMYQRRECSVLGFSTTSQKSARYKVVVPGRERSFWELSFFSFKEEVLRSILRSLISYYVFTLFFLFVSPSLTIYQPSRMSLRD